MGYQLSSHFDGGLGFDSPSVHESVLLVFLFFASMSDLGMEE
jgi:hypothetical protein